MKLTYLFLCTIATLILGYFSLGVPYSPTGAIISSTYHDYVSFTAQPSSHTSYGEGSLALELPGKVQSCTFAGTWITDNDIKFNLRNSCHGAQGTFTGYADATTQYVVNDPDLFRWAGTSRALINPPAERHDGYSLWMETCDGEYYRPSHMSRYGAQGTLSGFGTHKLLFSWMYKDFDYRPYVTFMLDFTCDLSQS